MKILFYLGHPAHFHLFKNCFKILSEDGHQLKIVIKKKDILETLLQSSGWSFQNISPKGRKDSKIGIAWGLIQRDIFLNKIAKDFVPDLMLGTSAEITHVGKLKKIPVIVVNEDDWDIVPLFAKLAYPFANYILAPSSCRVGKWSDKQISYHGYHELCYLHPKYFTPDQSKIKKLVEKGKYFILRFAKLTAHHDTGKTGITKKVALELIRILENKGSVFITSERELEKEFEKYRINIHPSNMHHALYFADLYIGDSQTMAAEAAVLGTPSIRFNDFVGEIGYLEELEKSYQLTIGIRTNEVDKLYQTVREILLLNNAKELWNDRRMKMLKDKIDVTAFMVWFIENYPRSSTIMKENPDYQLNFN